MPLSHGCVLLVLNKINTTFLKNSAEKSSLSVTLSAFRVSLSCINMHFFLFLMLLPYVLVSVLVKTQDEQETPQFLAESQSPIIKVVEQSSRFPPTSDQVTHNVKYIAEAASLLGQNFTYILHLAQFS